MLAALVIVFGTALSSSQLEPARAHIGLASTVQGEYQLPIEYVLNE